MILKSRLNGPDKVEEGHVILYQVEVTPEELKMLQNVMGPVKTQKSELYPSFGIASEYLRVLMTIGELQYKKDKSLL